MKLKDLLDITVTDTVIKVQNFTNSKTIIECEAEQTRWLNKDVLESEVKSVKPTKVRNLTVTVSL